MILQNDKKYLKAEDFKNYLQIYNKAVEDSLTLNDNFKNKLPKTHQFNEILISQNYEKRILQICLDDVQKHICEVLLRKENGYNKEGIVIAANSVMQTLNDIYTDFIDHMGHINSNLNSKESLKKYFNREEFSNVNIEIEYVFQLTNRGLFSSIYDDMNGLLSTVMNLDSLLGVTCLCLNVIIIFYLIFGFFSRLKISMSYISYSARKISRALYEI